MNASRGFTNVWRRGRVSHSTNWTCPRCRVKQQHKRTFHDRATPFAEKERVVLSARKAQRFDDSKVLSGPLRAGKNVESSKRRGKGFDAIAVDSILGKRPGDHILPKRGKTVYEVRRPTLKEYIELTPRLMTPIYPQDSEVIVSLLDIHPPHPSPVVQQEHQQYEILEAGTGLGSLTLFLSQAIHAFNSAQPPPVRPALIFDAPENPPSYFKTSFKLLIDQSSPERLVSTLPCEEKEQLDSWRAARRAVVHSVDVSPLHLPFAERFVHGFRDGLYAGNIDFHQANVREWASDRLAKRGGEPFLAHAVLDLPDVDLALGEVSKAIMNGGCVAVFVPSITQVMECIKRAEEDCLDLEIENVLELSAQGLTGGREWNIRQVRTRAGSKLRSQRQAVAETLLPESEEIEAEENIDPDYEADSNRQLEVGSEVEDEPMGGEEIGDKTRMVWLCRPKVGERLVGGGFVGLFRKRLPDGSRGA